LAPEAATDKLWKVINKRINKDDVLHAVQLAAESGIAQLKFYFMVGLPQESDDDVKAIADMAVKCRHILDKHNVSLSVNVAPFVPKANTPFQWLPMAAGDILEERLKLLERELHGAGIKLAAESVPWSQVQ